MRDHERMFTRIQFDAEVNIQQNNQSWPAELVDISLNGLLVKQPANWTVNPGQSFTADIKLADDHKIHMDIELVHVTKDVVGFKTEQIDIDSASTLRRLVELNIGSEELLKREFAALIEQPND